MVDQSFLLTVASILIFSTCAIAPNAIQAARYSVRSRPLSSASSAPSSNPNSVGAGALVPLRQVRPTVAEENDDEYDDYDLQDDGLPIDALKEQIVFDDQVYCHDPVDLPFSSITNEHFPEGFSRNSYRSMHVLCTNTRDEDPPGMGCTCYRSPFSSIARCEADRADPTLFSTPLQRLCQLSCYCRVWGIPRRPGELGKYLTNVMPGVNVDTRSKGIVYYFESDKRNPLVVKEPLSNYRPRLPRKKGGDGTASIPSSSGRALVRPPNMCRLGCDGPKICSTWAKDCVCHAKYQRLDPYHGTPIFSGYCGSSLIDASSGKRKRESELDNSIGDAPLCVCNSTYISAGCCEAGLDGIMWSAEERSLGTLDRESNNLW